MTILRSRIMWGAILFWIAYIPIATLIPAEHLFGILNAVVFAVSMTVVVMYLRGIREALTTPFREGGHLLILGLGCHWLASGCRHLFMWIWRYSGEPSAWINSPWLGFIPWLVITGACLHIAAKDAPINGVPNRNYLIIGTALASGLALALLVIWFGGAAPHFS